MARYFFSYAGIDWPIAAQIISGLQGAGIDVFWDQQGIGWGENWQNKIAQELETCDAYILLLGPQGIRRWVSPEVQAALCRHYEQKLPIFILLHSDLDRSQIPLFLNFSQHRSLPVQLDDANFFQVLVRELKDQVGKTGFEQNELPKDLSCPYPGLESFTPNYEKYFYGRQQETAELLTQFVMHKQRWLQIEGNSGVGKSSLVQSGLLPAVRVGWLDDGTRRNWHIAIMQPGIDPCDSLALALRTTLEGISLVDLTADIAKLRNVESADTPVGQRQTKASDLAYVIKCALPKSSNSQFFLVVDQLEEAITLTTSDLHRTRFDVLLASAISDPDCPFHLVTTIRSDFLLYFSELPELQKALQQSTRYFLKPIGEIGLLDAVTTPLRLTKGWVWPSQTQYHHASQRQLTLAETIVADALPERDAALPLASNLMNRLWAEAKKSGRREPSFEDYYALGGIGGALALSLDIRLSNLSDLEKSQAHKVLVALVKDNDNAPATRRRISKSQAIAEVTAASQGQKYWSLQSLMNSLRPGNRHGNSVASHNPERMLDWLSGIQVEDIKVDPVRMIVISGGLENETIATDAQLANDRKNVDLIHEILLRDSRATGQPYCKTLSQWVADDRQHLKNRNLRQQLTQRWLVAKQQSPWSAVFNDLANPKQVKDFQAAGSCTEEEKRFLKASIWYSRLFKAVIVLLILLLVSFGFAANKATFATKWATLFDLPIAWLHAQGGWKKYPNLIDIPAGTLKIQDQSKTIPAFRMADAEVTFAEYDIFVYAQNSDYVSLNNVRYTECHSLPDDEGWGRGNRPVINVSWHCAKAYIDWLNTNQQDHEPHYQLPSETQWEYAIRAGTSTEYFWEVSAGITGPAETSANVDSSETITDGLETTAKDYAWFYTNSGKQTHPVKQLKPNKFALHDMAGNVEEWTQDCWHNDYKNAPDGGTALEEQNGGDCSQRVLRGGYWDDYPGHLSSAYRSGSNAVNSSNGIGFRLAQD